MTRMSPRKKIKRKSKKQELPTPILVLIAVGAIFLVGAGYALFSQNKVDPNFVPDVTGRPSLKVDNEGLDFGDVPLDETVYASFELTNVGDKTLKFTGSPYVEIREGC